MKSDNKTKILVMDDERMILKVVTKMLNYLGFFVETAEDGVEAVAKYQKSIEENNPYEVIIMDLSIPGGMGGKKAIREILETNPKAKCIVSSGHTSDPIFKDYHKYGFYGVIQKPFILESFQSILEPFIKK